MKFNMRKANPMTIMAAVLVLGALYMIAVRKPAAKKKKPRVRFQDSDPSMTQNRPAPAHAQKDPNARVW